MSEFTVRGKTCRACRMNAFQQLHVARRLLPILGKIPAMIGRGLEDIVADPKSVIEHVAEHLSEIKLDVITETLAGMNQDDIDYILNACLDSVQIKDSGGTGWAQVRRNGVLMYDHIGMLEMLNIAANVIKDNLGDFFVENAPTSPGRPGRAAAVMESM